MLTISPVLQDFPRHDLHGLIEGDGIGLNGGMDAIRDAESKILEGDGHLSGGSALRGAAQTMQGVELERRFTSRGGAAFRLEIAHRRWGHPYLLGNIGQSKSGPL